MRQDTHQYQVATDTESPSRDEQTTASPPTAAGDVVLVVDTVGGHGARYQEWLDSQYDVRRTQSSDDIVAWAAHELPDAIVFDGTAWLETVESLGPRLAAIGVRYQTLVLTETRLSTGAARRITDECLYAPVDRDRLIDSLERAKLITTYDTIAAELLTLAMRRDMLSEEVPPDTIKSNTEFRQVSARIEIGRNQLEAVYGRLVRRSTADPLLRVEYDLTPDDFGGQ